ncbi:MAG: DNA-3-methyladenine glycosylase 2 family protein [Deltaproteobacteria bacterium]|nr:DNA-3-methyladenine glycosylase 2 family protein [Deltaproteobacteria bacterium]
MPKPHSQMLSLSFKPPFNFRQLTGFLKFRAIPGVEFAGDDIYSRSIEIDGKAGVFTVTCNRARSAVTVEARFPDPNTLPVIAEAVKNIFDLDAPVKTIDGHLKKDRFMGSMVSQNPGIRVPGSFNGFELCIRAIIGQQISVKGATTIIGRIAANYGKKLNRPNDFSLKYLFPTPEKLAAADFESIGLTRVRIATIQLLSTAVLENRINFNPSSDPAVLKNALVRIKGIGEWTAQYVLMRTVKYPDAFPCSDLGLLKAASPNETPIPEKRLKEMSIPWKPWRAYAAMHLWSSL